MPVLFEATSFGLTSTTDEVLWDANLQGKRILITGVSAGIGVETARSLAAHGAHVVGAARDLAKEKVDPNSAEALWKKSEEMVGESF